MSSVIGNKQANFAKVEDLIEKNMQKDTDIIILPEVWTVGWACCEFEKSAEDLENSEIIEFLSKIAKKYNTNIIGGSFITRREQETGNGEQLIYAKSKKQKVKSDDSPFGLLPLAFCPSTNLKNTCPVINRNGELVATYDKMHLFSYYGCMEGSYVENGCNPVMVKFDFNSGELGEHEMGNRKWEMEASSHTEASSIVKIGLSICYDIRFPEIYRAYAKAGADLLINMAAWPKSRAGHWENLTKARAIENQCFMVALTQSGLIEGEDWNLGHSRVIDFNGETVKEIDNGEGAMYAEIRFEDMYEFRKKCTVLKDIHEKYEVK